MRIRFLAITLSFGLLLGGFMAPSYADIQTIGGPCDFLNETSGDIATHKAFICQKSRSGKLAWTSDTNMNPAGLLPDGEVGFGRTCKAEDQYKTAAGTDHLTYTCTEEGNPITYIWYNAEYLSGIVTLPTKVSSSNVSTACKFKVLTDGILCQGLSKAPSNFSVVYQSRVNHEDALFQFLTDKSITSYALATGQLISGNTTLSNSEKGAIANPTTGLTIGDGSGTSFEYVLLDHAFQVQSRSTSATQSVTLGSVGNRPNTVGVLVGLDGNGNTIFWSEKAISGPTLSTTISPTPTDASQTCSGTTINFDAPSILCASDSKARADMWLTRSGTKATLSWIPDSDAASYSVIVGQTLLRGSDAIPASYQAGNLSGHMVELVDVKNSPYMWFPEPGITNVLKDSKSIRQNLSITLVGPIRNVAIVLAKLNSANQVIGWNLRIVTDRTSTNDQIRECKFTAAALPLAVDALSISTNSLDIISNNSSLLGGGEITSFVNDLGLMAVKSLANSTGASALSNGGPYDVSKLSGIASEITTKVVQEKVQEKVQTAVDLKFEEATNMNNEQKELLRKKISQYEYLAEKSQNVKIEAISLGKLPITKDALSSADKFGKFLKLASKGVSYGISHGADTFEIIQTSSQTVEDAQKMWHSIVNTPSAIATNQQLCNEL